MMLILNKLSNDSGLGTFPPVSVVMLYFLSEQGDPNTNITNEAVQPCGPMWEQQKLTSSVFKLQEQRMFSSRALFQFFELAAMDSWSLTTLQFSHLATVKLLKQYPSLQFIRYYC